MLQQEDEKKNLQQGIGSGQIATVADLQTWVWRRGWRLRVTKQLSPLRQRVVIVSPGVASGFQLEVPFDLTGYEFQQPGIWIYGLLARTRKEKACYIGQSAWVMRRFAEHAKRSRNGRGSDAFFGWSDRHKTEVYVVLFELCKATASKADTARRATILEGAWLSAAIEADYQTPGSEKWGQLPRSPDTPRFLYDLPVWQTAMPLEKVIERSTPLKHFWLGNAQSRPSSQKSAQNCRPLGT